MVMEALQEDMGGEASTQCSNHTFKTTAPGGICAFCLQEKLGKLVSSSVPTAIFPSSSSSPSPSFRSDFGAPKSTLSLQPNSSSSSLPHSINNGSSHYSRYYSTRAFHRIPFLHTQKRKKKKDLESGISSNTLPSNANSLVFKRSKSITAARHGGRFTEGDEDSPRKRGFWSFLHISKHNNTRKIDTYSKDEVPANGSFPAKKREEFAAEEDGSESPHAAAVGRNVSRSRSVGCGSRSFSGDFFERISSGFGDCTLRRVESQREGKHKIALAPLHHRRRHGGGGGGGEEYIKERVKCGGIFSGFMVTSSSSSSSSSSCLMSSSGEDSNMNSRPTAAVGGLPHGRSKSWGWAFASPIRALSKPNNSSVKTEDNFNKKAAAAAAAVPNLNAIPSLLAVRG
ncbi:Myristoylated alanine-rich C-kinase [Actinidia chinensis var. chinensis]|uniref:Myristoylated alanine-rich C-kinase n=1 Tax=Actinidia chinensis var. chinensis TaxID=1590841 RepID=A0A2R6R0R1_ACTCC|nr:Myristoylated alanine-rich C-kinase [Actinidia chinensis var. chinensis]PSS18226.1 Myristoylated alanine-rich C-kinase [Actinidia chinensis var. chinensis]